MSWDMSPRRRTTRADRRRRVALDAAYARLEGALAGRGAPLAVVPDTAPRDAIVNGISHVLGHDARHAGALS